MNVKKLQDRDILNNAFATVINCVLYDGVDGGGASITIYHDYVEIANLFEEYLHSKGCYFKRSDKECYVTFIDNFECIAVMNHTTMKKLDYIVSGDYYVVIP